MPHINTLNTTAIAFIGRLSENPDLPTGELIQICGEFQRGDEDTGVWPTPMKRAYIDSLLKGYPTGVTMIVKPPGASHTTKWMILDGANRARALRDFMNDKFTTAGETKEDKKKFWEYLRKNLKISSDNDAVTINGDKGTKQVGRQNYRSAGAGVQKVTGNIGNDIQKCLKRKLKESEQV